MGDAGYRGVSAAQDGRFGNKDRKLIRQLEASKSFPASFNQKVDLRKVQLQVIKPWIENRVQELLGFEDDVVSEYVVGQLESDAMSPHPDPRQMQVSLTGFLESSTPTFMSELWSLLLSAQESVGGIPREFVEKKKEEMRLARERDQAAIRGSGMRMGNRSGPSRPTTTFRDKQGNHTSRVQDAGWGSRARLVDDDRYSYQRRPVAHGHDRRQRSPETDRYTQRQLARVQEQQQRRERTRSPSYSRSPSRSQSPPSSRRRTSPTQRRPRYPSYSHSPSPRRSRSPARRRQRSPSYSRSDSHSRSVSLDRSRTSTPPRWQRRSRPSRSPPPRRRSSSYNRSASRSPTPV